MFMTMARTNPLDDARRPCPACGQPIHQVAGRCKYCRTDLVKLRDAHARPARIDASVLNAAAAASTAPAPSPFAPAPAMPPGPLPMLPPPANGVEATPTGLDLATPPAYASYPESTAPRSAWSRRWPTLVVVIAGVAIAVCAYLLLVDGESQASGSGVKKHAVSPAPDRMDTMPAVPAPTPTPQAPQGGTDPWGTAPDPSAPDPSQPPPDPTPTPPQQLGSVPSADEFYPTMMRLLCNKLKQCGGLAGGASADDLCEMMLDPSAIDLMKQQSQGGKCKYDEQKASSCLASIDKFQCSGGDLSGILGGFSGIVDCSRALDCMP